MIKEKNHSVIFPVGNWLTEFSRFDVQWKSNLIHLSEHINSIFTKNISKIFLNIDIIKNLVTSLVSMFYISVFCKRNFFYYLSGRIPFDDQFVYHAKDSLCNCIIFLIDKLVFSLLKTFILRI
jgi:hypothetical protein